jgi:putative two-component system response regulator
MKKLSECVVLAVDDAEVNLTILADALSDECEVAVATDGPTALAAVAEAEPDLILLDVMLPGMDGFDVLRRLKADEATAHIPVILVTALADSESKARGFELGAVDYVPKPFDLMEVRARVRTHLSLLLARRLLDEQKAQLAERERENNRELVLTQQAAMESLAALAEHRRPENSAHISRIKRYVRLLTEAAARHPGLGPRLTRDYVEHLTLSAPLHDIGKIAVPEHILLKPGPLTEEEYAEMRLHVEHGLRALASAEQTLGLRPFLRVAKELVHTHHERWDGQGYPSGLQGEEIPLAGRIMALADVYDALVSRRVYKAPFPHCEAVRIIREGRGTQFDPDLTDIFLMLNDEFRLAAFEFAESDEERRGLALPLAPDQCG